MRRPRHFRSATLSSASGERRLTAFTGPENCFFTVAAKGDVGVFPVLTKRPV